MSEQEKAPRTEYDQINLHRDTPKPSGYMKTRFMGCWHEYCKSTGDRPTQGEFLMILLDLWERRKEEV